MRRFAVTCYCSSCTVDRPYHDAAGELGLAIGSRGWTLVYGGNHCGLMGDLADAVRQTGGRVVGVSPPLFGDVDDKLADEFVIADDMRHRKAEMERRGDAFVVLPGGIGTLEEFFEILVGRHLAVHDKPVLLVNVNGFYDPLIRWLRDGTRTGFVRPAVWDQLEVLPTVTAALERLDARAG